MGKPLTWIKNYFGNKLYPYTHMDAVYTDDEEKKTLATTISELKDSIDNTSKIQSDWNEDDTGHDSYIKNKPLSLPANGGNSDTLEGKHASDFTEKNIFDAHLTDSDAHQELFNSKLNIESANKLIKNISSDASTGIIMVTRQDNTTFTINIPRSLIFQSAVFNEQSNEIIITWSDHSESRIPVEGLVDIYSGSEGNIIQIEVDDNNIISAVVKEGSIGKNFLSQNVQNALDASHEHISNTEKHIPNGGISGQIIGMTDSGVEWVDANNPENYITETDFAAIDKPGIVKPDGYTTVCNNDGTITAHHIKTINIVEDTDLNTVLSPGFYCCQTTSIAKSLLNCPVQTPFNMVVKYATGTAQSSAIQELTTYTADNPKTYKRSVYHHNVNNVHAVGNWCLVYDENNKPPKEAPISYFSITDLGLDANTKYMLMDIFDNLPSKSILYLGDCSNVSNPPENINNPSITINKITKTACYAMAVSRSINNFKMAYKILRGNDPKGETEWIEMCPEVNLTAEDIGALPISGGELKGDRNVLLSLNNTGDNDIVELYFKYKDDIRGIITSRSDCGFDFYDALNKIVLLHVTNTGLKYKQKRILTEIDTVNNLLATKPGNPLDAVQGKVLADMIDEINGNLSHVGMIIHSTTLDTEAKVIAVYGGTKWLKIEGRFLLGVSSSHKVNSIGGEKTHTLTATEMPRHRHSIKVDTSFHPMPGGSEEQAWAVNANAVDTTPADEIAGGGGAHNNMPPYKAVYIWERTA